MEVGRTLVLSPITYTMESTAKLSGIRYCIFMKGIAYALVSRGREKRVLLWDEGVGVHLVAFMTA
jgi:hypothetical protein